MPKAYGGDRLTTLADGSLEIQSTLDKGWRGQRSRTNTSPEFPGTPVLWEEEWFEVVHTRRRADGTCVYALRAWREDHAIRNPSRYDEESEKSRHDENIRAKSRSKSSRLIALAGLVVGHAPAHAQVEIEREHGISAATLSLTSTLIPLAFAVWTATRLPVRNQLGVESREVGIGVILFAAFLFIESMLRIVLTLSRSSPCGSIEGLLVYEIWRIATPGGQAFESRAAKKAETRLKSRVDREADDATAERDAYLLRLPFLALLSAEEQRKLQATFGFEPGKWGIRTAAVLGIFGALGALSSFAKIVEKEATAWTWSSLFVAALLLVEQVKRLTTAIGGGPAGSVLGAIVRPWCRDLLLVRPRALREGTIEPAGPVLPSVWEGNDPDDQTGR